MTRETLDLTREIWMDEIPTREFSSLIEALQTALRSQNILPHFELYFYKITNFVLLVS